MQARDDEYLYELSIRLNKLKRFYRRASAGGRAVMFYTDDPLDWSFQPSAALNGEPESDA